MCMLQVFIHILYKCPLSTHLYLVPVPVHPAPFLTPGRFHRALPGLLLLEYSLTFTSNFICPLLFLLMKNPGLSKAK